MPKNNINYLNTIIYKIVCNDLNIKDLYIGSTTDFYNRKSNHKSKCNSETDKNYNLSIYKCIRANGGWDNWSMVEVEKFPCKDSLEARARERYWCEQLNATLNSNKPYITDNEIKECKEYVYFISGYSKKGTYVSVSIGNLEFVLEQFMKKYPRFNGEAFIYKTRAHRLENIVITYPEEAQKIDNFYSSKDLNELFE
jgi:hypothetical protein